MNDPDLADPYNNATIVQQLIPTSADFSSKGTDEDDYTGRVNNCFGDTFKYDSNNNLVVSRDHPYEQGSDEYIASNCAEGEDCLKGSAQCTGEQTNWLRIRKFIVDSVTAESMGCFYNQDDSCAQLGSASAENTPSSGGATTGEDAGFSPTGTAKYGAAAFQLSGDSAIGEAPINSVCQSQTGGNNLILCSGVKYRDLIRYDAVHNYTGKQFTEMWTPGNTTLTLDCSLFASAAFYLATGVDLHEVTSQTFVDKTDLFTKITDLSKAQPGDFAVSGHHIAIVNTVGAITQIDNGPTNIVNTYDSATDSQQGPITVDGKKYPQPTDLDVHPISWNNDFSYLLRYNGSQGYNGPSAGTTSNV
jgi:hypothetical protein